MKKILLIVSSHEDAALLPQAAKAIGKLGCGLLWVWHSPILGIDPAKECSVIDAELKVLREGEKSAAALGDYETAKQRKADYEKLIINRSIEVRNAWKRVSPEGRKEAIGKFMEPLMDVLNPKRDPNGMGIRISAFPEHQEADLWLAAINEVKAVLEKSGFKGGEFAMMWPRQLVDIKFENPAVLAAPAVTVAHTIPAEKLPLPPMPITGTSRQSELEGLHHFTLYKVAKGLNVNYEKRPKADIIKDILAAEEMASLTS